MESVFLEFRRLNGTTWFYLSFLLMIAVYFRFSRFFSLRNWDLITLFLIAPGVLATTNVDKDMLRLYNQLSQRNGSTAPMTVDESTVGLLHLGYTWLFVISAYFLIRCIVDLFLTRRPRIEPNLNNSGLAFLGITLLAFLIYEVVSKAPDPSGRAASRIASRIMRQEMPTEPEANSAHPGTALMSFGVGLAVQTVVQIKEQAPIPEAQLADLEIGVARSAVILCHLLILAALILIGWQHFGSPSTGMGMATLYLLAPMTAMNIEKIDHLLPSVFLVWAIYAYRKPAVSGSLLGMAGLFFFPLFLLPLWTSFYWKRGAGRFLLSFAITSSALWLIVWWLDPVRSFMEVWTSSVAWKAWDFRQDSQTLGFWTPATQFFRLPIFVVFFAWTISMAFWPTEKNLAEVIALSVALILGVQLWYADRGGAYIHWYLPLALLMIFRPNLSEVRPPIPPLKPRPA